MSTETITRTVTKDTGETITAPELPADDRTGDGYDWMETLTGTSWSALPSWASEGWDAGAWPYIIFAVARHRDEAGELFGYGTYVEGDTRTCWFRSQAACFEAITEEASEHRVFHQWMGRYFDFLARKNVYDRWHRLLRCGAKTTRFGDDVHCRRGNCCFF